MSICCGVFWEGAAENAHVLEESAKSAALQSEPDLTCFPWLPELSCTDQCVQLWYKICSLHHLQINYASKMDVAHIFNLQLLSLPTFPNWCRFSPWPIFRNWAVQSGPADKSLHFYKTTKSSSVTSNFPLAAAKRLWVQNRPLIFKVKLWKSFNSFKSSALQTFLVRRSLLYFISTLLYVYVVQM